MDFDELTEQQAKELQATLQSLLGELERQSHDAKKSTAPVDLDLPIGRLSRMDAIQQTKMAQANQRNTEQRIQQVRAALASIQQNEYGWCKRCDGPIGYPRLKARPETPFCLECQSQFEQR